MKKLTFRLADLIEPNRFIDRFTFIKTIEIRNEKKNGVFHIYMIKRRHTKDNEYWFYYNWRKAIKEAIKEDDRALELGRQIISSFKNYKTDDENIGPANGFSRLIQQEENIQSYLLCLKYVQQALFKLSSYSKSHIVSLKKVYNVDAIRVKENARVKQLYNIQYGSEENRRYKSMGIGKIAILKMVVVYAIAFISIINDKSYFNACSTYPRPPPDSYPFQFFIILL